MPEVQLSQRAWVVALLQSLFGLQLQDVLDLFGPGDDGALENVGFVFVRGGFGANQFGAGHRQHGLTVDQPDHHEGLGDEVVVLFHEVFGDQVGPALLVVGVLEDGTQHFLEEEVAVLMHVLSKFQEDQGGLHVVDGELLVGGETVAHNSFLLELGGVGALVFKGTGIGAGEDTE